VRKVDDEEALIVAFASHKPSSDTHCLADARQVEFTPTRIYAVDMDLDHERLIPSLNPGILKKVSVFECEEIKTNDIQYSLFPQE
jgi:hypothetical protein